MDLPNKILISKIPKQLLFVGMKVVYFYRVKKGINGEIVRIGISGVGFKFNESLYESGVPGSDHIYYWNHIGCSDTYVLFGKCKKLDQLKKYMHDNNLA